MIHYLDTSALVKRYVAEPGSSAVRALFRARTVATARVAYAEVAATLARLCREGRCSHAARDAVYARLDDDFAAMSIVEVRPLVVRLIPALVVRRSLRGYDAVHLAAAVTLVARGASLTFWAADRGLIDAAAAEGLKTVLLAG